MSTTRVQLYSLLFIMSIQGKETHPVECNYRIGRRVDYYCAVNILLVKTISPHQSSQTAPPLPNQSVYQKTLQTCLAGPFLHSASSSLSLFVCFLSRTKLCHFQFWLVTSCSYFPALSSPNPELTDSEFPLDGRWEWGYWKKNDHTDQDRQLQRVVILHIYS